MKINITSLLPLALLRASEAGFASRDVGQIEQRDAQAASEAPKLASSPGHNYVATFNPKDNEHGIKGTVKIFSDRAGPASVEVSFDALPSDKRVGVEALAYHIHEHPVQILANGTYNCTATGAHFDPYKAGEATKCDATKPQTCQLGDLAGKHGGLKIDSGSAAEETYLDEYISTSHGKKDDDQARAFIGRGRSIVVHGKNKARLACANLVEAKADAVHSLAAPGPASSSGAVSPTAQAGGNVPLTTAPSAATASPGCGCTGQSGGAAAPSSGAPYPMPNNTVSALPSTLVTAPGTAPVMPQPTNGASGLDTPASGGDTASTTASIPTTATGSGLAQSTGAAATVMAPVQGLLLAVPALAFGALGMGIGL